VKGGYAQSERGRELLDFRGRHQPQSIRVDEVDWTYLTAGEGDDSILFLGGGTGYAEDGFDSFAILEGGGGRVIAPSYPEAETMGELVENLHAFLGAVGVVRAHVWGDSFGAMVAQRFAQEHGTMVGGLVLSNAAVPTEERAARARSQLRTFSRMPAIAARRLVKLAFKRLLGGTDAAEQDFWDAYLTETFAPRAKETVVNLARLSLDFQTGPFDTTLWTGPTLVIEFTEEPHTEAMLPEVRSQYPDATFITLETSSEEGAAKSAALCAREVLDFVT
jgi:pimeloyl-ACP methyl ester carboxylesterase